MPAMSYPCFGTVLALRDVFLHLIHLQLMREIPDQQLLWLGYTARQMDCFFTLFTSSFAWTNWQSTVCLIPVQEATLRQEPLHLNRAKSVTISLEQAIQLQHTENWTLCVTLVDCLYKTRGHQHLLSIAESKTNKGSVKCAHGAMKGQSVEVTPAWVSLQLCRCQGKPWIRGPKLTSSQRATVRAIHSTAD